MGLIAGGGEETSARAKSYGKKDFEMSKLVMLHHRCGDRESDGDGGDVGHEIGQ